MRIALFAGVLLINAIVAPAQSIDTSGLGAAQTMVRAAGMPLRDGALEPGTLTVRVVRSDFSNNIPDQIVDVQVAGGRIVSAKTGSDGRAQFPHIEIGAQVKASAKVGGELLESETFAIPAESGVRVLLVAGGEAAHAAVQENADVSGMPPSATVNDVPATGDIRPAQSDTTVIVMKTVLACTTVFTLATVVFVRRRS